MARRKIRKAEPATSVRNKRLYKTDVVRRVAKETRLSQRVVGDALNQTLKEIASDLAKGHLVVFPGFGTFYTRMRPASIARSFATGKAVKVPPIRLATFRAGRLLKIAVRKERK